MPPFPVLLATILLLSNPLPPVDSIVISEVLDIIKVSKDVVVNIAKAWNLIDDFTSPETAGNVPIPFMDKTERKLFNKLGTIGTKLDAISAEMDAIGSQTIATVLRTLPERVQLELRLNDLLNYMTAVDVKHRHMMEYAEQTETLERHTLEDFAESVVSHDGDSVRNLLERIYAYIVPSGKGLTDIGLLRLIGKSLQEVESDMVCNAQQSPQQVLYNLYNAIALTELKGYTMVQFSYMLLKLYDKGNFTREAHLMRSRYEYRTNSAIQTMKKAMSTASQELWLCDPPKHVEGETYVQITQLLQGYIQNEVDLNPEGTCRESCSEYTYTKSHGCYQNLYCRQQRRCNGKILKCQYIDSDMWVCPSDAATGRRYEYVEYENGRILGRKQGCRRGTTKVDSWWRWLFWHCSYCLCLCDEQGYNSDRFFNLRAAMADVSNNMVVTGLRFVKENRIIHLQIQEGKLLPRGKIDQSTVRWVPVDNYTIMDKNVYSGQDFHTLTWEKRALDLDDLKADEGHLMTGVRFKVIGNHLNFEIFTSPFDFESGKLIEPQMKSIWKDNPNTDSAWTQPRKRLDLPSADIPTRSPSPSIPDSQHDQYIEFSHTDLDRDAAQTTIPFIDSQPVESLLPVPLSGAGIYHKGRRNFGGFVAPKIITYDYSRHMKGVFDAEPSVN